MELETTRPSSSFLAGSDTRSGGRHATHFWFLGICIMFAVAGLFSPNGLVTSVAFLALPPLGFLLWREGEPPVLLFGCIFQWLQATAAIFYTNHFHQTLEEAFGSDRLSIATWLSIVAVLVLAIGVRFSYVGAGPPRKRELEIEASELDVKKVAALYFVSTICSFLLSLIAWQLPAITQPIIALASMKWVVVFLLCYTVLHQRRGYWLIVACIGLELAMGTLGIFADFKSVFFVLVVAAMSSPLALRGRRLATTAICFGALFILGVVWTAIKTDYREFLANQETANEEAVPIERKFTKLADLVEGVTWGNFTDGIDALVLRVSYVNFFALTIENVPSRVPYENGELWKGCIAHVLTPRFLFPNKPALDDSERTRLYTGVQVAGVETGTSIGIGYIGESYVDYGPIRMFMPVFLLGLMYGLINRFLITRTRFKLLGAAFAVAILIFSAYEIETSNVKLVGGVVAVSLVATVIYKTLGATVMTYLRPPRQPNDVWRHSHVLSQVP